MIIKDRSLPEIISSIEALLNRVSSTHHAFSALSNDLNKRLAGHRGEEKNRCRNGAFFL